MKNTITVEFRSPITGQLVTTGTYTTKSRFHAAHNRISFKYGIHLSAKVIAGDLKTLPYKELKSEVL